MSSVRLHESNIFQIVLTALALCLVCLRAPLSQSLWLDELVTWWVIKDGAAQAIERSLNFQGQSPLYYLLLCGWSDLFGNSELALRSLSVVLWLASCFVLYRLGKHFLEKSGAAIAVMFFASFSAVQVAAFSARPYSLALFFCVLSVWFLESYRANASSYSLFGCLLATLLAIYAHYLYGAVLLLHLSLLFRDKSRSRNLELLVGGLFLLGAIPALLELKKIALKTQLYDQSRFISTEGVWHAWLQPNLIVIVVFSAVLCAIFFKGAFNKPQLRAERIYALMVWSVLPPLILLLLGWISGAELGLPRYYLWYAPGYALVLAYLFSKSFEAVMPRALLVVALMFFVGESQRHFEVEDWRGAVASARAVQALKPVPVLYVPGLVEANSDMWLSDPSKSSYLLAPFSYYALELDAFLLPLTSDPDRISAAIKGDLSGTIERVGEFILIVPRMYERRAGVRNGVVQAYQQFFEKSGFSLRTPQSGVVQALHFFKRSQ